MPTLHIVQGDKVDDRRALLRCARSGRQTYSWIVPKAAAVGDEVVVYIGGDGFFATARVSAPPVKRADWNNRYGARLDRIRLISPGISLSAIRSHLPGLRWANYPRSIVTPSSIAADEIRRLIAERRRTGLPRLDSASLQSASLPELRAAALLRSRGHLPGVKTSTIRRVRSQAIRLYVLARANGRCESCGEPGPFQLPDGSLYLEPHHTTRVADDGPDHPACVLAVCPNCHSRAHHSADATRFNLGLVKKARALEKRNAG